MLLFAELLPYAFGNIFALGGKNDGVGACCEGWDVGLLVPVVGGGTKGGGGCCGGGGIIEDPTLGDPKDEEIPVAEIGVVALAVTILEGVVVVTGELSRRLLLLECSFPVEFSDTMVAGCFFFLGIFKDIILLADVAESGSPTVLLEVPVGEVNVLKK